MEIGAEFQVWWGGGQKQVVREDTTVGYCCLLFWIWYPCGYSSLLAVFTCDPRHPAAIWILGVNRPQLTLARKLCLDNKGNIWQHLLLLYHYIGMVLLVKEALLHQEGSPTATRGFISAGKTRA